MRNISRARNGFEIPSKAVELEFMRNISVLNPSPYYHTYSKLYFREFVYRHISWIGAGNSRNW